MLSILQLQRRATCDRYDPEAYLELCRALVAKGQLDSARMYFNRWQGIEPNNRTIAYQRSVLLDADTLSQLPAEYVVNEFDSFSASFDEVLADLAYRVPSRFGELLTETFGSRVLERVLDLGCGTGLCGMVARRYANHLCGVDISAGMLRESRRRGIYDALVENDFLTFLDRCDQRYDLILAGDSLIYVGDMEPIMQGSGKVLTQGGLMLMSFEMAEEQQAYRLSSNVRFQHGPAYLEKVIGMSGMHLEYAERCVLRMERGEPVQGLILMARRDDNDA